MGCGLGIRVGGLPSGRGRRLRSWLVLLRWAAGSDPRGRDLFLAALGAGESPVRPGSGRVAEEALCGTAL